MSTIALQHPPINLIHQPNPTIKRTHKQGSLTNMRTPRVNQPHPIP